MARGRQPKPEGEKATTKAVRLYEADSARLQRLMVRLRISEGAVVRRALAELEEMLDRGEGYRP